MIFVTLTKNDSYLTFIEGTSFFTYLKGSGALVGNFNFREDNEKNNLVFKLLGNKIHEFLVTHTNFV